MQPADIPDPSQYVTSDDPILAVKQTLDGAAPPAKPPDLKADERAKIELLIYQRAQSDRLLKS